MTPASAQARPQPPWRVPVSLHDVPEAGRHFDLAADEATRSAIAKAAGLRALPRLEASFDVTRRGTGGLHLVGQVSATVGQDCVVTLEPVENEVAEAVDLIFSPATTAAAEGSRKRVLEVTPEDAPEVELLVNDTIDLGAIATEFLLLGVDPYPRKAEAVFEAPSSQEEVEHPFSALASLRKGGG
jgi:uncharacterized metal-binding protein YceD (DUF177 family)